MVLGVLTGLLASSYPTQFNWVIGVAEFFASIFLRLLKMIIVPLIITSIITGVISIGGKDRFKILGTRAFLYYFGSSLLAISCGLILVNIIQPGVGVDIGLKESVEVSPKNLSDMSNIFIRMIPINFFESASKGDMLAIIFFCIIFAYFLLQIDDPEKSVLIHIFSGSFQVIMKLTNFVLYFAPLGIWGIITKLIASAGLAIFIPLAWYCLCVSLGLLIHGLITLPSLILFFTKSNPYMFLKQMRMPLLTAFTTSSSSATLPVTMKHIEEKAEVSHKVSRFILPLGSTINMDGTALYECVAVIFIAQAYGVSLDLSSQIIIVFTALLASIGAAGVPMAGLVMMSVVLTAVGLPLEGVGLIIAVDRVLDMLRTTINVWSDSCGALIMNQFIKDRE